MGNNQGQEDHLPLVDIYGDLGFARCQAYNNDGCPVYTLLYPEIRSVDQGSWESARTLQETLWLILKSNGCPKDIRVYFARRVLAYARSIVPVPNRPNEWHLQNWAVVMQELQDWGLDDRDLEDDPAFIRSIFFDLKNDVWTRGERQRQWSRKLKIYSSTFSHAKNLL